jgi:YVTN family beta-propeller protein
MFHQRRPSGLLWVILTLSCIAVACAGTPQPRTTSPGAPTAASASDEGAPSPSFTPSATATRARVLVVNTADASVSVVDLAQMREERRVRVGERPYGVAVTRDGSLAIVGVEGEERVRFYDLPDMAPRGELRVGPMHNDHIVLSPDGSYFLIANYHSDSIIAIDARTLREAFRIEGLSAPHVIKYGPRAERAYVTCKKITGIGIVDPGARSRVAFHQINVNPRSLTFNQDESRVYFGSFWVDGVFEMETESGRVTRLLHAPPPAADSAPREVTYHGVEMVGENLLLAANEGRSYIDAFDPSSGRLLSRLTTVSSPCCIEPIPGSYDGRTRVLVSNLGDATVEVVEVASDGAMVSLGDVSVGGAPKRVALLPDAPAAASTER